MLSLGRAAESQRPLDLYKAHPLASVSKSWDLRRRLTSWSVGSNPGDWVSGGDGGYLRTCSHHVGRPAWDLHRLPDKLADNWMRPDFSVPCNNAAKRHLCCWSDASILYRDAQA